MSMTMFVENYLNVNDSEAFSYSHFAYTKKRALFTKTDLPMFRKTRPK